MIKHIFIATIKPGISDTNVEQAMQNMRAMKDTIPEIKAITVGRSLGWAGSSDTVSMVIDVADHDSFNRLLAVTPIKRSVPLLVMFSERIISYYHRSVISLIRTKIDKRSIF